ncbi:GGDEF domain-containing protein [bacterium]|nr:GGDEF domain-containing protein [bacterium]
MDPSYRMPYSLQVFTTEGERLSLPADVPYYCRVMSDTPSGRSVCNRGCGFSFAGPCESSPFQIFSCPFGVTNASLLLPEQPGSDWSAAERCRSVRRILVGGRVFRNYVQFTRFVEKGIRAGAVLEDLLEPCASVQFEDPNELRLVLQKYAAVATEIEPVPLGSGMGDLLEEFGGYGLPKPSDFDRDLESEINRCERFTHPLTLALVRVNMSHWPAARSDERVPRLVLKGVADVFRRHLRDFDRLTCLEAAPEDEVDRECLAIMLPETYRVQADVALRRILCDAQERFLSHVPRQNGTEETLFFQVGLAQYPVNGTCVRDLMKSGREDLRLAAKGSVGAAPAPVAPPDSPAELDDDFTQEEMEDLAWGYQGREDVDL